MADGLREWLEQLGLGKYADILSENEIDLDLLPHLDEGDLKDLGLPLGPRRKIRLAASQRTDETKEQESKSAVQPKDDGEYRQVTVLFADLTNFTKLSAELDAENLHEILNLYFSAVDEIVNLYGGKIDKHIGDAVMAVFGAPVARTDDPVRAVRAAYDIHGAIAKLSSRLGKSLQAHVGIASGYVVASSTGSDKHREYTVTGETVNLASRLDDLAKAGETLISKAVYEAVSTIAICSSRGEISVAGFEKSVPVWAVERIESATGTGRNSPFIGRGMELRQFRAFVDECLEHGGGHSVLVRGEPGIGKTRLVEEFMAIASAGNFDVHRSLIIDFGVGKGQDAVATLVRSLLALRPEADEDARHHSLERLLNDRAIVASQRVFLNDLLDLPQGVEQQNQYDAMDERMRSDGKSLVITKLVLHLTRSKPQLIVFEDIHWAETATLNLIRELARCSLKDPVLNVFTSRVEGPSMESGWIASLQGAPITTIDLQPLSSSDTIKLARSLAFSEGTHMEKIVSRSEGNPLYLEQLIRNASDANEHNIPGTLRGLVQARTDRLPDIDKKAITAASVVGQQFSLEAVRAIIGRPDYNCETLLGHRLIRPVGNNFLFDHALIRDAVYFSLLAARRKELHLRAASFYFDRDLVLNAQHLELAQSHEAPRAYLEAAELEAKAYHTDRATQLIQSGLAVAQTPEDRFLLYCRLAEWQLDAGKATQSMDTFNRAHEFAANDLQRCRIEIGFAANMRLLDQQREALAVLDNAEAKAQKADAQFELAQIHHLRGNLLFVLGELAECRRQHSYAHGIAENIGAPEIEARALGGLADASYAEGKLLTASEQFSSCVSLSEKLGLGRVAVANRSMFAITVLMNGKIRNGLKFCLDAIEAARHVGHDRAEMVGRHGAHQAHWYLREPDASIEHTERALELAKNLGSKLFEAEALIFLAEGYIQQKKRAKALKMAQGALELCRAHGMSFIGPMVLSKLALVTDDIDERKACLSEAEMLLANGSLSHNHVFFYRDAIEVSLETGNFDSTEGYAAKLENYALAEPMPVTDFLISRARILSRHGRGERSSYVTGAIRSLIEKAETMELMSFLDKLEYARSTLEDNL